MNDRFTSGSLTLVGHLAGATSTGPIRSAVVIVHGFPSGPAGMAGATASMPELADRIADEMGMVAFAPCLRGIAESEGDYSIGGWVDDLRAAIDHVKASTRVSGVWLAGFGSGGAVALAQATRDDSVRGVATMACAADFDDWVSNPRRLVEHAREVGAITRAQFPPNLDQWAREFREVRASTHAANLAPRPLLVMHGTEDEQVPPLDARIIADAHHAAELRFVSGAGHRLRFDPRAMAVLLGWLDRQREADTVRRSAS